MQEMSFREEQRGGKEWENGNRVINYKIDFGGDRKRVMNDTNINVNKG